jgi:ferredoxin
MEGFDMQKRKNGIRAVIQWSVAGLVVGLAWLHLYGNKAVWAPLDAYCPFGGLESLGRLLTESKFIAKTQPSNLAIGLGLVFTTLIFGGIFCGWICPLGTLQDGLFKLGRFLKLPQLKVAPRADRYLRWLRYGLFGLVLAESFQLARLWFADYDPFRIIFGFHWISEPEKLLAGSWVVAGAFFILALLIRRFWCRFLCPLGLVIQWLSKISLFRLRWNQKECVNCNLCSQNCPMVLEVKDPKLAATECNHCLECVRVCPQPEALKYQTPIGSGTRTAIAGVLFFGLILIVAQLAGWWNPKIGSDPESIKGWMTFTDITEKYGIPFDEMRQELKLPRSITADSQLRALEEEGGELNTEEIRQYVARRLGLSYSADEPERGDQEETPGSGDAKDIEGREAAQPQKEAVTVEKAALSEEKRAGESVPSGPVPVSGSGVPDPATLKGSMSLMEVSVTWGIPVPALLRELNLPAHLDPEQPIRALREAYGVEKTKVQETVKELLKQ